MGKRKEQLTYFLTDVNLSCGVKVGGGGAGGGATRFPFLLMPHTRKQLGPYPHASKKLPIVKRLIS